MYRQSLRSFDAMLIISAQKIHCHSIAKLHIDGIKTGFLSKLGHNFLTNLYKAMVISQYSLLLACVDENGQANGFVSASKSTRRFYLDFLLSFYSLKSVAGVFGSVFNKKSTGIPAKTYTKTSLLLKCLESLSYPFRKKEDSLPMAELLSIVVKKERWGSGIAEKLLEGLKEKFFVQGIKQFKVVVGVENIRACRFYENSGGKLVKQIEVHRGEMSNVYVFETI